MNTSITKRQRLLFAKGSKTFYNTSRFFPSAVRYDVFVLYGFVRTIDDCVDKIPQKVDFFQKYKALYYTALQGEKSGNFIIDEFAELTRRRSFAPEWIEAFFHSMNMDIEQPRHTTLDETLRYTYGSAEVIGLCMARIMDLDKRADKPACLLGRALQFINFIRDIAEDNALGRMYLPLEETTLLSLDEEYVKNHPAEFQRFIHLQLQRYQTWMKEASEGYAFMPRQYRIPIKTASKMYDWTAKRIAAFPLRVFQQKIKPARVRIVLSLLMYALME